MKDNELKQMVSELQSAGYNVSLSQRKSKFIAYFLWLISIIGWLGFHNFYLGRTKQGFVSIFTLGGFFIGSLKEIMNLDLDVEEYNDNWELNVINLYEQLVQEK